MFFLLSFHCFFFSNGLFIFLLPFFSFPFLFPFSYPFFFLCYSFLVLLLTLLPLLLLPNRLPNRQDFINPPLTFSFSPSHHLGPSQRCSPTFPFDLLALFPPTPHFPHSSRMSFPLPMLSSPSRFFYSFFFFPFFLLLYY